MPSLRCLLSALTQAGGGDLLSVQSCCGEGWALQADAAMCGEHSPCSGQAASSLGALSPGAAHLFPPRRAAPAARGLCALSPGRGAPFPSSASGPGSQGFVRALPRARCAFSLRGERPGSQRFGALSMGAPRLYPPRPQRMPPVGSQEVFRSEPGPVCRVGGGGFSGAEFAPFPFPCLLPPAGMGRLFSGVSQPLCFANRRRCVPPVNFCLTLPQFKKISL